MVAILKQIRDVYYTFVLDDIFVRVSFPSISFNFY